MTKQRPFSPNEAVSYGSVHWCWAGVRPLLTRFTFIPLKMATDLQSGQTMLRENCVWFKKLGPMNYVKAYQSIRYSALSWMWRQSDEDWSSYYFQICKRTHFGCSSSGGEGTHATQVRRVNPSSPNLILSTPQGRSLPLSEPPQRSNLCSLRCRTSSKTSGCCGILNP